MNSIKKNRSLIFFLLPSIFFMTLFVLYPIVKTFLLSFTLPHGGIGLENYIYTYGLDSFKIGMYNTLIYTFFVTLLELIIAIGIGYLLKQKIKFKNTFQTIFFLPYVTSVIAVGTVFKVMYNFEYGIFNQILMLFNIPPVQWLGSEHALLSMIILGVWKGLAFNILIIFTAFSTMNANLLKAAQVDGFSRFNTFSKVELPQIKGVLIYLLTIDIIFNIKVYEEVVSLYGSTTPGPGGSANTIVYMLSTMTIADPQVAAVLAVTLLIMVLVIRQVIVLIAGKGK